MVSHMKLESEEVAILPSAGLLKRIAIVVNWLNSSHIFQKQSKEMTRK